MDNRLKHGLALRALYTARRRLVQLLSSETATHMHARRVNVAATVLDSAAGR